MIDLGKTTVTTQPTDLQPGAPPDSVITECELADAPEKVWRALTVPELLKAWLPEARNCETLASEPHRSLRYRWSAGEQDKDESGRPLDSVVTFELERTATGGTYLRVIHHVLIDAVARNNAGRTENVSVVPFAGPRRGDIVSMAVGQMSFGAGSVDNIFRRAA